MSGVAWAGVAWRGVAWRKLGGSPGWMSLQLRG